MSTYTTGTDSRSSYWSEMSNSAIFDIGDFGYEFSWHLLSDGIDSIKEFGYEIIVKYIYINPSISKFIPRKFTGNKFKLGGSKK